MINERIYFYEDRKDVYLTTYIRDDSPEMLGGVKRPAVLVCPGGAYINCSDREAEPIALRFAAMGYQAFVLRYSTYLMGEKGYPDPTKELTVNEKTKHPAPLRETGKAMLMLKDNADKWLVDPDRIFIIGFSAGAHNCAMYSTNWYKPVLTEYFDRPEEDFRPAAAILCYTVADYLFMKEKLESEKGGVKGLHDACNMALMGTFDPDDDMLLQFSPTRQVNEKTPPMFLWATADDSLVPVQNTLLMAKALADKNIPFEVHVFEDGPHGLALSDMATASTSDQVNDDVAQWVPLCEAWLKKRFGMKLPEPQKWF